MHVKPGGVTHLAAHNQRRNKKDKEKRESKLVKRRNQKAQFSCQHCSTLTNFHFPPPSSIYQFLFSIIYFNNSNAGAFYCLLWYKQPFKNRLLGIFCF
jgi:hypothetical protein